tara:strand:+ start:641 stop:1318 length:678 start_codon:yes stop_codon:yes gene_type:complete
MAYYLGRDVKVWLTTESTAWAVTQNGSAMTLTLAQSVGTGSRIKVNDGTAGATFALAMDDESVEPGDALSDLTGVDIGIGVTDEDVTYMGARSVLKAEIKKETTIALTKKKTGPLWDLIFNGDGTRSARWGVDPSRGYDDVRDISDGLKAPKDHLQGTDVSFGYRVHVQLASGESISVPACQVTGHTVTLNADGTTEETMEFMSNATPFYGATPNVTTRMSSTTI